MSMNLKPFRDYSEHEVINLYAAQEGTLTRGTFLEFVSFDPDSHNGYGAVIPGLPVHAYANDYNVYAKVKAATTKTGCVGMALYDVKTTLDYPPGQLAILADPVRLAEQQVVPSGRAVPIVKRGIFEVQGFSGTPYPGAAALIGAAGAAAGQVSVGAASLPKESGRVGTWLSVSGADGAALLQVNCL